MSEHSTVLIIGGGPAGIQASRIIKKLHPAWAVTMVRPERASMVYCAIPYALEGVISPDRVVKDDALVTDAGVQLIRDRIVTADLAARRVQTQGGRDLSYSKLLIATGSVPIRPNVPGIDLKGIIALKTEDDMLQIQTYMKHGAEKAVVIGAGAIGLEQALAYRARGLEVHIVDQADRILPHLTDADTTEPALQILADRGIRLHLNARLAGFDGDTDLAGVRLDDGTVIPLKPGRDFSTLVVGMKAETGLFEGQLDIDPDGISVDPRMLTSIPDTYAAGDCVQGWSGIDGQPMGGKLATNAVPMAKIAALNLAGRSAVYPGFYNGAATVVGDLRIGGSGFTENYAHMRGFETICAYAQSTSRFPMMPGARPVRVKLIADARSGRLLGGQITGYEAVAERIDLITLAIQQKMTADQLAQLSYSAQPWQTFFPAMNPIVDAASTLMSMIS